PLEKPATRYALCQARVSAKDRCDVPRLIRFLRKRGAIQCRGHRRTRRQRYRDRSYRRNVGERRVQRSQVVGESRAEVRRKHELHLVRKNIDCLEDRVEEAYSASTREVHVLECRSRDARQWDRGHTREDALNLTKALV